MTVKAPNTRERERTQNSELYYSRIEILGSCLFLQSVLANLHANKRDRERDRDRETDRETETERDRQRHRHRERAIERERELRTTQGLRFWAFACSYSLSLLIYMSIHARQQ